jgi:branched-chain amino acid transport system substrate-binding protein
MRPKTIGRRLLLQGAASAGGLLAAPAIVLAQADKEIVVAAVVSITGTNAGWGQPNWDGFRLACEMVNAQGGIKSLGGAKLKPIVGDTESKPQIAGSQAEKVIRQGAVAMVGANQSAAAMIAAQIGERQSVSFICSTDTDPAMTARGFKYTFRTVPLMPDYVRDLFTEMKKMADKAGTPIKTVAALCENSVSGKSAVEAVKAQAESFGLKLVDASMYDASTAQNFTSYIARYKADGVDAVVGHNRPNDAILIARTMKELKYNPKFAGGILGAHSSREYMETLGKDADGIYGTSSFGRSIDVPAMKTAAEAYEKKFNKQFDSTAGAGFTALSVIVDALERAKSADPKAVREAIATTDMKTGDRFYLQLNGAKFDAKGENTRAGGLVFMIKDGKPITVAPAAFATGTGEFPKPAWRA